MNGDPLNRPRSGIFGLWKKEPNGIAPQPMNGRGTVEKTGRGGLVTVLFLGAAFTGAIGAIIAARRRARNGAINGVVAGIAGEDLLEELKAQARQSTVEVMDGAGAAASLRELQAKARESRVAVGLEPPRRRGLGGIISGLKTFESLRYRDFRYLWLAQITNSASMWMEQIARPILIIDIVPDPKLAAVHVGGVLAARTFPQLGFGLFGGVLADWFDRRMLILVSKVAGTIINFVFAFLIVTGQVEIWHIYATSVLRAIAMSFDNPARQALIPSLVAPEHLANAIALNSASMQTMRIFSASLAGLALAIIGVSGTFMAVAIIGTGAVALTYMMRVPPMPPVQDKSIGRAFSDLWDGLVYSWQAITIRGVLILTMAYFTLGMAYLQVFAPLLAKQVLGIGNVGFGFLVSATGVGALTGSLIIATLSPSRGRGPMMLILMTLLGVLLIIFGGSTYLPFMFDDLRWVASTFFAVIFLGAIQSAYFALSNTVLLEQAPTEKRGRIMGVLSQDRAMITLGGTLAGFLSAAIGPQIAQVLFGATILLSAFCLSLLMPSLRKIE